MSRNHLSFTLSKQYAGFSLNVDEALTLQGVTAIYGPSGAGKSTLLRLLAGFEKPQTGKIIWNDRALLDTSNKTFVPAHKRPFTTVFQDARLFDHLSVARNLDFAVKRARSNRANKNDTISSLHLGPLLNKLPAALSGGERQRVCLARALLSGPDLLFLDEPLSSLDLASRRDVLPFLEKMLTRFETPAILVSHDMDEVARLSHQILVMNEGEITARGPVETVINQLGLDPVIGRFETSSLLTGTIARHDTDRASTIVDIGGATIIIPQARGADIGTIRRLRIRARDVSIATEEPSGLSIQNVLPGKIIGLEDHADRFVRVVIQLCPGNSQIIARITHAAALDLGLGEGQPVFALIKSVSFDGPLS